MSAQQNMGENLVFIPHQILIFDVEIFDGALKFRVSNDWGRRSRLRKFLAAVRLKFLGTVAGSYSGQHFFFFLVDWGSDEAATAPIWNFFVAVHYEIFGDSSQYRDIQSMHKDDSCEMLDHDRMIV